MEISSFVLLGKMTCNGDILHMRIVFVIPTLGSGGAERVVTLLSNNLVSHHDVSILCIEDDKQRHYSVDSKIVIRSANLNTNRNNKIWKFFSFGLSFFKMRNFVYSYIKNINVDILISFLPKADFVVYSLKHRKKIKWISSERNDPWERSYFEKKILERIYKKVDCLVCQTEIVKQYYKSLGITNISVIPNPVITSELSCSRLYKDEYGKYFVAIGRLDIQKNYDMMIESFILALNKTNNKYRLLILGDGSLKNHIQELINSNHLQDKVFLLGKKENVKDFLLGADCFVMSSNYEGMPNALLEAMSIGLPVICTDVKTGAARDLIDSSNGILVPVGNVLEMSNAMVKIMSLSPSIRTKMGEQSKKKLVHLSLEKIIPEWEELLSKVTNK